MGVYVRIEKVNDDGKLARYSFRSADGSQRILVVDREEERLWPEDGIHNIEYNGAARALVKAWRQQGDLPDKALHQA
jgi:hypothetical protein